MSTPDPDGLLAVAALQRCLERRDYAGAARVITARPVLDGLRTLTGPARQKALERDLRDVVALLVSALADSECTGEWSCLHCGAVEAKAGVTGGGTGLRSRTGREEAA